MPRDECFDLEEEETEEEECSSPFVSPRLFLSCPAATDPRAARTWFVNLWNHALAPHLARVLRDSHRRLLLRQATGPVAWEDPLRLAREAWPWGGDPPRPQELAAVSPEDVGLARTEAGELVPTSAGVSAAGSCSNYSSSRPASSVATDSSSGAGSGSGGGGAKPKSAGGQIHIKDNCKNALVSNYLYFFQATPCSTC